jgi:hypothetical protein
MRLEPFHEPREAFGVHLLVLLGVEEVMVVDRPEERRLFGMLAQDVLEHGGAVGLGHGRGRQFRLTDPPRMRFAALAWLTR